MQYLQPILFKALSIKSRLSIRLRIAGIHRKKAGFSFCKRNTLAAMQWKT